MNPVSSAGPRLVPRARLHFDNVRNRHVVLVPESVLALTPTAAEILALCDGRPLETIVSEVSARYPKADVGPGVFALLDKLAARGLLEQHTPSTGTLRAPYEAASLPTTTEESSNLPVALLAELTYRCPLRCGYCSNPVDLARYRNELETPDWQRVFREAASLGVLQLHLSGGEPLVRTDLTDLVIAARAAGMYTNLITSAYGLTDARLDQLAAAGLDHIQVSFQDTTAECGDAIAGTVVHEHKLWAARAVKARGLALSLNVVIHRGNVEHVGEVIALADSLGAQRLELANAQYHGWALRNREALLPDRAALERAFVVVSEARTYLGTRMTVLYVLPDYHTDLPKPCMNGWGRRFITVTPNGIALPCPGAHALPLAFESVLDRGLAEIWHHSSAFNAYRGQAWMPEPCASCERRNVDYGGCRCQAFALTGDARNTDPACAKSPLHALIIEARDRAILPAPTVLYRVRTGRTG